MSRRTRSIAVLLAMCVTGCDRRPAGSVPSGGPPPALVLPDLSNAGDAVRTRVRERYDAMWPTANNASRPAGDRSAAFGAIGQVLLAAGYADAAEAAFLHARALAPADPKWPYYLGYVNRQRDPAKAAAFFEETLARRPDDIPALIGLGESRLAAGRAEAAAEPLQRAVALDPRNAAAQGALGRAALARRDYAAAVRHLEDALAIDPIASSLRYPLSLAYRGAGDAPTADRQLQQRGDIQPAMPNPLVQEMQASLPNPDSYDAMARDAIGRGDWTAAAGYARQGIELAGGNPRLRASLELRLGTALAQTGDAPGALGAFERAIAAAPQFAPGHYTLGVMLMSAGRTRDAIERFSIALEYEPSYVEARVALGDALRRSGQAGEALGHYRLALERAPADPAAAFGEAIALVRLRRYEEARDRMTRAMQTHSGDPAFPVALGRLLAAAPDAGIRDGARAVALVRPLMLASPTLDAGEALAMAMAEVGDFDGAVGLQREVIDQAKETGRGDLVAGLLANLQLYEQRRPCRTPWRDEPWYEGRR